LSQYFLDTSALVKYYHPEMGALKVKAICSEQGRIIRVSRLGVVETQSAFAMKMRSGALTGDAARILRARLLLDIAAGEFEIWNLSADHLARAERLIARHGYAKRLLTLDAIQLAVGLELMEADFLDLFVASDKALLQVARAEGVPVFDPETS